MEDEPKSKEQLLAELQCLRERVCELEREQVERKKANEAFRESAEHLRLFIEHSPVSMAMFDLGMRYISHSRKWLQDTKLGERDLTGVSLYESLPDIQDRWKSLHQRVMAGEILRCDEDRCDRSDGSVDWLRWEGRPWYDATGGIGGIIIFTEDITAEKNAEDALHEGEERLRIFIEHSPAALAMFDREMRYISWSRSWVEDSGIGDRDLTGVTFFESLPDMPDRWKTLCERVLAGEVLRCDEDRFDRADGTVDWLRWEWHPWHNASGYIGGIVMFGESIAARKAAEDALRESERRFRLALRNAPVSVAIQDNELRYIWAYNQFAMSYGEIIGKTDADIFPADEAKRLANIKRRVIESNLDVREEMWLGSLDGRIFLDLYFEPVRDGEGRVKGVGTAAVDLTAIKQAEGALLESRAKLKAALASMYDSVLITDAHGDFVDFNDAFANFNRFGNKDECPKGLAGFSEVIEVHALDGKPVPLDMWLVPKALRGESATNAEYNLRRKDTGETWVGSFSFGPIRDRDGAIVGSVVVGRDVTERKRMEEELRKSRDELELRVEERTAELKSVNEKLRSVPSMLIQAQENERQRLAADLHDSVGQTLAALKFRIEHVITTLEKEEYKQSLHLLHEFVPVLQSSIDETRTIYRGLKPPILTDFGILAALEWYRQELLKLYHNQHIELQATIREEDVPEDFKVSIFRIVQEALNNAFKHGNPAWIDIRLFAGNGGIGLEISDDGIGMDLDYIMKSTTAKSLGLIGMRERAEITGGEFTIKSVPNEGTTVKVFWRNPSIQTIPKLP